jgi:CheY-like chemotaxis protein
MKKVILIIDDDRDIRESLRDTLADEGYRTAEASDGSDGLAYLRAHPVALILLDWNMAPMDAPAFMAALSTDEKLRDLPVVLLTADLRVSSRTQLAGFVACLKKPVNLEKLFELARRYCGDPHAAS